MNKKICQTCGKKEEDCKGTKRYDTESNVGLISVVEYCDGLIERD